MDGTLVLIGRVSGAFGVRGEVRIRAYGDDPALLLTYGPLCDASGQPVLSLISGRAAGAELIGRARGVDDKDAADALRGRELYIPRSRLPEPDEDEFYLVDLIGLEAFDPAGDPVGRIRGVQNFGAGDVLEVAPKAGASFFVAFTRETVPEISVSRGRLVLVRPREIEASPESQADLDGRTRAGPGPGGSSSPGGPDVHQALLGHAGDEET